jgi:hypothetical protein
VKRVKEATWHAMISIRPPVAMTARSMPPNWATLSLVMLPPGATMVPGLPCDWISRLVTLPSARRRTRAVSSVTADRQSLSPRTRYLLPVSLAPTLIVPSLNNKT